MSDVAEIAGGLTEETRADLLSGRWHIYPGSGRYTGAGLALTGRGFIQLTPLGLAVHQFLESNRLSGKLGDG